MSDVAVGGFLADAEVAVRKGLAIRRASWPDGDFLVWVPIPGLGVNYLIWLRGGFLHGADYRMERYILIPEDEAATDWEAWEASRATIN